MELLPDPEDPDWLARLTVIPGGAIAASTAGLAECILLQHTYRKPFADRPVEPFVIEALIEAAHAEKAWFQPLLTAEARQKAAALVIEGDALHGGIPGATGASCLDASVAAGRWADGFQLERADYPVGGAYP
ncbi:hypothetical protein L1047_14200 [Synechococcus sp. Nb3U1]|uniref:hypothetical protein n=1 Tax=Synechococcus sp. Nb3U1 TaxID=1914529 RepID=UPI001F399C28|nr:hypothetical protein [Synechococcus sp. Nb3U1]MCF2972346.1 hypothetical protein [Synechococcus sp. Nb3U1]